MQIIDKHIIGRHVGISVEREETPTNTCTHARTCTLTHTCAGSAGQEDKEVPHDGDTEGQMPRSGRSGEGPGQGGGGGGSGF